MHYLLLTTIAIALWGSLASLAVHLNNVPPFFILAVSLTTGGCLSLAKWRHWQFKPMLIIIGVLGIFGYHFFLFMALRLAPAVSANLINYLWPIFILLFTPLFFKEFNLSLLNVIGAIISFVGVVILISGDFSAWSMDYTSGYIFAFLAALTWSLYSLLTKKITTFTSATVGLFCLISGGLSLIAHIGLEESVSPLFVEYLLMVLLGVGPLGAAFYCWDSAIKKGDPRVIATLSYFTPLISTLLLMLTSGQQFTTNMLTSLCLIIGGALVANLASLKKISLS